MQSTRHWATAVNPPGDQRTMVSTSARSPHRAMNSRQSAPCITDITPHYRVPEQKWLQQTHAQPSTQPDSATGNPVTGRPKTSSGRSPSGPDAVPGGTYRCCLPRTIIQTKTTQEPSSPAKRAMPVKAFQHCQQPADAAQQKRAEPLAISLLSAEAPPD